MVVFVGVLFEVWTRAEVAEVGDPGSFVAALLHDRLARSFLVSSTLCTI